MLITTAMGREVEVTGDYSIDQNWDQIPSADHERWDRLYARQSKILKNRACPEFLEGLHALELSSGGIPNYEELSDRLEKRTGWRIVAVPDLVPDPVFFEHLANRRFPAASFIRDEAQLDYIEEPDAFHDIFGHVPLIANPVFADFLAQFGKVGVKAVDLGALQQHARLYWFTVEFGLIRRNGDLKIYGAGIASSKGESIYSLEDDFPRRPDYDLMTVLRTPYWNDDIQDKYFVADSFQSLFETLSGDLMPLYKEAMRLGDLAHTDPRSKLAETA
jgi:phenylalanine-4-hydroxylase